jgi:hypothetical protein
MKKSILMLLLSTSLLAKAQLHEIPLNDFKDIQDIKEKKYEFNVTAAALADSNSDGIKLIVTGLDEDIKTKVQLLGSLKPIAAQYADKKAIFPVLQQVKTGILEFKLIFDGKERATITFKLEEGVLGAVKSQSLPPGPEKDIESYIGAITSANFVGNNKFLSNLTPIINLGGVVNIIKQKDRSSMYKSKLADGVQVGKEEKKTGKTSFYWDLDINPYLGGEIDTKDSNAFIPAMMLYGRAGLTINNNLNWEVGKSRIIFMPLGFGLKFIPNLKDSSNTIIQHNLRVGFAYKYAEAFLISAQYTHGFHNITSESEKNFKKVFGNMGTDISYLTVTGTFAVMGKSKEITNYVFMEWRGQLGKSRYADFTNNRILTVGVRKTLDLSGGIFQSATTDKSIKETNKMRGGL